MKNKKKLEFGLIWKQEKENMFLCNSIYTIRYFYCKEIKSYENSNCKEIL